MYKKHPPLGKTYNKTLLVIENCITKEQLEGASNMVKNFKTLYKKVGYPKSLSYNLDRELSKKNMLLESLNKPTKNKAYGK